jgi:hypothetical protein
MAQKLPLPNIPKPKAWQRQRGETSPAFEAFVLYRDMTPPRSVRRICEILDKHKSQINGWSSTNRWVARCQVWDNEVDRRATNTQVAEIKSMKRRQAKVAFEMQATGHFALEDLKKKLAEARKAEESGMRVKPLISPDNIVRMIDAGARLERLNFDEPDNITEVQGSDFSNLSLEEMLQLRRLLDKSEGHEQPAD